MAGKSWQPGHEASHRKWEQAPVTLNKQWKEGGKGWGKLPGWRAPTPHNTTSTCSKYTLKVHASTCMEFQCMHALENSDALCC